LGASENRRICLQHEIRPLDAQGVKTAVEWARLEGWNPGLSDAEAFGYAAAAFSGAYVGDKLAATISLVRYGSAFAFLGFYICRPEYRGKGLGWALWSHALAGLECPCIGLDGVKAQQDNYAKSGFVLAHGNVRFGGPKPDVPLLTSEGITGITPEDAIAFETEHRVFPAPRNAFLQYWLTTKGHFARGFRQNGRLRGYGVIRPCYDGHKIGRRILSALLQEIPAGNIFLDVTQGNPEAVAIAKSLNLAPMFETARMYRGPAPDLDQRKIFGITSFELG
jgi:GNAT superfamily N-acetyltransferase